MRVILVQLRKVETELRLMREQTFDHDKLKWAQNYYKLMLLILLKKTNEIILWFKDSEVKYCNFEIKRLAFNSFPFHIFTKYQNKFTL